MRKRAFSKILSISMAMSLLLGSIGTATAANPVANVDVDISTVKPNYHNLAQYNNLNPRGAVMDQINDFNSYNTKMVRYFSLIENWYTDPNDVNSMDMDKFDEWYNKLNQAELYSDSILMPIKAAPPSLSGANWNAATFEAELYKGIKYMKQKYSKLEYISCWNEPNHPDGFLPNVASGAAATVSKYNVIYDIFEKVVKQVNLDVDNGADLKLGGPITAGYQGTSWIKPFIQHAAANNLKLDFITWNVYSSNANVGPSVAEVNGWLTQYGYPNAEVIISEYGLSGGGRNLAPTAAQLASQTALVASMGYQFIAAGVKPIQWINEHSANYIKSQYGYNFKWSLNGTTTALENYAFPANETTRYVRIQGYGNVPDDTSITDTRILDETAIKEIQVLDQNGQVIPIVSAYAGGDFANISKMFDNNYNTWWEENVSWKRQVTLDLGSNKTVSAVKISWKSGHVRSYKFAVQTSTDEVLFKDIFNVSVTYPLGHLLNMENMLGDESTNSRVLTTSDATAANGQGVRALATKNNDQVAVLVWNYQNTGNTTYDVDLDISALPPGFAGKNIKVERYIVGQTHSNYAYDGATTLEKPVNTVVTSLTDGVFTFPLAPNDVSVVILTPN